MKYILGASLVLLVLFSTPCPCSAYGDPPSVTRFQDPDGTFFQLELIPVEYIPSPELVSAAQNGIAFLYRFLKHELGAQFPQELTFKIRMFADPNQHGEYLRTQGAPILFPGVYFPHLNEIAMAVQADDKETRELLFHETVHAFMRQALPSIPRWMNEGLAQYFSTLEPTPEGLRVSPLLGYDYYVKQLLASGELTDLRAYLEVGGEWEEYNEASLSPQYGAAWSVIYFLMGSPEGQTVIRNLIAHCKNASIGQIPSTTETINLYYPGGIEALDAAWRADIPQVHSSHIYASI